MSKTLDAPPKLQDEDIVAELPLNAVESMPVFHSVQDPAELSAAAMGRHDSFTCAKRSSLRETLEVRVILPLAA